jgi:hypothetical protein
MKNRILITTLCIIFSSATLALPGTDTIDVDNFLRTVDLMPITHTEQVINLDAQLSDPAASTTNINDMTDFLAMSSKSEGMVKTWIVEFNSQSTVLAQKAYRSPWVGVGQFKQSQIPTVKLQDGLALVKSCIATKMVKPAPVKVHRVVIYKAIQSGQIVYDYIFKMPRLSEGSCQEILYTPDTNDCEMGMVVACHATVDLNAAN